MDKAEKRRQEILREMEMMEFDPSLPVPERYDCFCEQYARLRREMLALERKKSRIQQLQHSLHDAVKQAGWTPLMVMLDIAGAVLLVQSIAFLRLMPEYPGMNVLGILLGVFCILVPLWVLLPDD